MRPRLALFLLLLVSTLGSAAPLVGQPLPVLLIEDKGEAVIVGENLEFQPWSTDNLRGRWTLMQYLAARTGARKINRPAIDAIQAAAGAEGFRDYRLINLINVDDVVLGLTGIAMGILETNKKKYPDSPMIADMDHGRRLWELQRKSSAIFLLDADNRVRFFKDGALDATDIARVVNLLRLESASASPR